MRYFLPLLFVVACIPAAAQNHPSDKKWSEVYRYELKDLPKSALKVVDSIYIAAKKQGDVNELMKSLLYQSKFAMALQENSVLTVVENFQKEIDASKPPLRNILHAMLAEIYWEYFQSNRWQYYNRSAVSETLDGIDFRTWDAPAILKEIDQHFQQALQGKSLLESTKLEKFDDILVLAENSKHYRPTLYDLLAHYAISFYATDESGLNDPSARFNIDRYFAPIDTVTIAPAGGHSGKREAMKLFQQLLKFHQKRKDTTAYVNLELERLRFVEESSTDANAHVRKEDALQQLQSRFNRHPASALVSYEMASMLVSGANRSPLPDAAGKQKALAHCEEAIAKFPGSDGAIRCEALRQIILAKQLSIRAEKFIPVSKPSRLLVEYANVPSLSISVYKVDDRFEQAFLDDLSDSTRLRMVGSLSPSATWRTALPDKKDFNKHSTEVVLPSLTSGTYVIIASPDQTIGWRRSVFGYTSIHVTDLALLQYYLNNDCRFQVVNRNNGKPVARANVRIAQHRDDSSDRTRSYYTDKEGFVKVELSTEGWQSDVTVSHEDETVSFGNFFLYKYETDTDDEVEISARTFLFTDRSIYRPGQTVYFKGILIKTEGKRSGVVSGEYVEVFFEDVNGKEVATQRLKTNSFGSFNGEFKLPVNGLTGEYSIYADEDSEDNRFYEDLDNFDYDEVEISVEEYKRPTFEVKIDALKGTYKVNDSIAVKGNAASYSSAKVSKAKVSYTVKRRVQIPRWFYWDTDESNDDVEVAHGETTTDAEGKFEIPFVASPDVKISEDKRPVFTFAITVDVTDINGETRSASSLVKVGYHSMVARITGPAQIDLRKPLTKFSVTTENLNGQRLPAQGIVKIFKLKNPETPKRDRPWAAPDLPMLSPEEFEQQFPHDSYGKDVSDPRKWEKGKLMKEISFDTRKTNDYTFTADQSWAQGAYIMELETRDSLGRLVEDRFYPTVVNAKAQVVPDNAMIIFRSDKNIYRPGDVAVVTVGSAAPDMYVTVEVEQRGKVIATYIERISNSLKEFEIPVHDSEDGEVSVHCSAVAFNFFIERKLTLAVKEMEKHLKINTETFTDKIQPGAKQTWSFSVGGEWGDLAEAEVLASMYDASLDQFKPHEWKFDPLPETYYYSRYFVNPRSSFQDGEFVIRNVRYGAHQMPRQYYDGFDWFGFNLTNYRYAQSRYLERLYYDPSVVSRPSKVFMHRDKKMREGYVSGRVTSATDGQPLPGVNVLVRGTSEGTVTDQDGYYSLPAGKNDVLVFTFIGLSTAEVELSKKNVIDVAMDEDVTQLSEVVVTGYGMRMEKKNVTYAVSRVENDTTASEIVFQEVSAMSGRVAGVQITSEAKRFSLHIRGTSSFDKDMQPLYVVDGVIVDKATIDEADFANAQVLKGSAATAIYGSRAANGVIIISTKSGQQRLDNELAKVNARKNFNETAFFFPHLITDEEGRIRFTFTSPESLTRWKLQLLAHTRDLLTASKTLQCVTEKQLMVTPNPPRFLRTGDDIILSAKIANLTNRKLSGKVALQLTDAVTGKTVDVEFRNVARNQTFKLTSRGNTQVSWVLNVPSGIGAVQYRIVAKAGNFSDGEQNVLPVLENRMLVTESLPLFVRSNQTKKFTMTKLQSVASSTLRHHQVTFEITSNSAWYAVQSLPYLMEFPHECAEQLFSRYYSNSLANHILNSSEKIKAVFDKWASAGELNSSLEMNQELKSVMIEETPWLRDAESETEQKKRLAMLFDLNTMSSQLSAALAKLEDMQFSNGGFPWFAGAREPDIYITQHIASELGHLTRLNVKVDPKARTMVARAVKYLDRNISTYYNELLRGADHAAELKNFSDRPQFIRNYMDEHIPSSLHVHYLYMRSFFPDTQLDDEAQKAVKYFQVQTAKNWRNYPLYTRAQIALVNYRDNNKTLAHEILQSLKENASSSEELGMYWKENVPGWYWYQGQIETQALLIETFAEIDPGDINSVDELRVWLLKNKQTNSWNTTRATTEAIYALLLNGTNWLSDGNFADVTVGSKPLAIDAKDVQAATGYFKTSWRGEQVKPELSEVTVTKKDDGISWGAMYWQYFEDLDKITAAETPLKLKKNLYKVVNTDKGELLNALEKEILMLGDRVRVRIQLSADRDMEYVHMKDMRAAGFEPVDVLSEYKWQENLGYYQSTRDASTNFFFAHLPKGVYIFEYDLRVNNRGDFSNGVATIQCMYAPEFTSHSQGIRIKVE